MYGPGHSAVLEYRRKKKGPRDHGKGKEVKETKGEEEAVN